MTKKHRMEDDQKQFKMENKTKNRVTQCKIKLTQIGCGTAPGNLVDMTLFCSKFQRMQKRKHAASNILKRQPRNY